MRPSRKFLLLEVRCFSLPPLVLPTSPGSSLPCILTIGTIPNADDPTHVDGLLAEFQRRYIKPRQYQDFWHDPTQPPT